MQVLVPLGTRPEIVKLAPVVSALRRRSVQVCALATGQHSDPLLSQSFFEDLALSPDVEWDALPRDEAERVGTMLTRAYREIERARPDVVVVLGDTYTVPVFCLAARRHRVPIVHLEAGLRSFNDTSMEEVDRRVAAATASLHLAPTPLAARFLLREGVAPERVRIVGNPVLDVLRTRGITARPVDEREGVAVTAHRATNVDDPARLVALVELVERLVEVAGPVTFPVHPRTRARLGEQGLSARLEGSGARLLDPLPYDEMLALLARSRVAVTDSGGLQEEASWLGVPVVVLRKSTPRWEGVLAGTAVLTGMDVDLVTESVLELSQSATQRRLGAQPCPYGDGATSERVADILLDPGTGPLLRLEEPDFVGKEPPQ